MMFNSTITTELLKNRNNEQDYLIKCVYTMCYRGGSHTVFINLSNLDAAKSKFYKMYFEYTENDFYSDTFIKVIIWLN